MQKNAEKPEITNARAVRVCSTAMVVGAGMY